MPIAVELVIVVYLLGLLYVMTWADPNWRRDDD